MNNNDLKMPIILIGNSFKYEVEATVKLFIHASRFNFFYEITDVSDYDEYIKLYHILLYYANIKNLSCVID